jgi:hypothetical protein
VKPYWDAFAFPFRREHLGVLVFGLFVLTFIPAGLSLIPIGGSAIGNVLDLLLLGYYAVFLQSILSATMEGSDRIPAWPELESPMELANEFFTIVAPFLISFLPLILLRVSAAGWGALQSSGFVLRTSMPASLAEGAPSRIAIELVLLALGWLYLPMATLAWTFYGGSSILNPAAIAKAAWNTGPRYLLVAGLVWMMVTAAWAVSLIPGEFLTSFGSSLLVFYALIVAIRLVGTHYRLHREQLGWERMGQQRAGS